MCDRAERRFTAEEREEEHYQKLYAEVEAADQEEYDRSFGSTYKVKYPFKADVTSIRKRVDKLMRSGWDQ